MRELKAMHDNIGTPENITIIDTVITKNDTVYILYVKLDGTIGADTIDKFTMVDALHTIVS